MNRENLYAALSKVAWGYFFLHFNLNLGTIGILPNWVCYLLILGAIPLLSGTLRDLPLLRPFCILLGVWAGACWALALVSIRLEGTFYLLDLLVAAVSIYFHFQLLTDMATLADHPEVGAQPLGQSLRRGRTLLTVLTAIACLPLGWDRMPQLTIPLALLSMGTALYLMYQLFALRRRFAPEPEETP